MDSADTQRLVAALLTIASIGGDGMRHGTDATFKRYQEMLAKLRSEPETLPPER